MDKEIEGIVEIGSKPIVERRATATGVLNLSQASAEAIQNKLVKASEVVNIPITDWDKFKSRQNDEHVVIAINDLANAKRILIV